MVSRCSRWWSFNVEANSANTGSDGEGKSEGTEETADTATEALKTQLADIEVRFVFCSVVLSLVYVYVYVCRFCPKCRQFCHKYSPVRSCCDVRNSELRLFSVM